MRGNRSHKLAKSDIITKEVRLIIGDIWREHRNHGWTAKEIQTEVARRGQATWPGKHKPGWPGVRAVQEHLAYIKEQIKPYEYLEQPWHLGFLVEHPEYNISAEAVAYIGAVQVFCRTHEEPPFGDWPPVTIRQALWIARLYREVFWHYGGRDLLHTKLEDRAEPVYRLWQWSKAYADYETICKLPGDTTPDTSELDRRLYAAECPIVSFRFAGEEYPGIVFISRDGRISRVPAVKDGEGK